MSLGELVRPRYESVVQYFDAEHAPDAAVMWSPQQMFHDCVGNHGSLGGIQARAPFIAAGPGIRPRGIVPSISAPSMLRRRSLPCSAFRPAMGSTAESRRSGVRLAMQDGDEITELLDPDERPDHVVVFLWDGVNPGALHDAVDRGEAPGIASLIERGTSYRHGCISALPTATLANHTTQCTGVFPDGRGTSQPWYDRTEASMWIYRLSPDDRARDHLAPVSRRSTRR